MLFTLRLTFPLFAPNEGGFKACNRVEKRLTQLGGVGLISFYFSPLVSFMPFLSRTRLCKDLKSFGKCTSAVQPQCACGPGKNLYVSGVERCTELSARRKRTTTPENLPLPGGKGWGANNCVFFALLYYTNRTDTLRRQMHASLGGIEMKNSSGTRQRV